MRNWLTADEQIKLNAIYNGYSPKYKHVHLFYQYVNGSSYGPIEFDVILTNTNSSSYNDLKYGSSGNYRINTKLSYKSWTLDQLLELVPSTIYCDNEYNAVDKNKVKNYHTLKLHIIKRTDANEDIDYMYKVMYKPEHTKGVYKHIKLKKHDFKDPCLEGDELITLIYDLILWCISHGHLLSKEKS